MRYVVGLVFSEDKKKIVLIQKYKPEWQKGFLNGVGGKVEEGESVYAAMCREFQEEAGVKTDHTHWENFANGTHHYDYDPDPTDTVIFFKCFDDEVYEAASTMEKEPISKFWVTQLVDYPLIENLRWVIPLAIYGGDTFADFDI